MADGNARDTTPAPPLPGRIRGMQSERDGALVPDAQGELPWPLIRLYPQGTETDMLVRATMRHRQKACLGAGCDDIDNCSRHGKMGEEFAGRSETVAIAAVQIRAILEEAVKLTGSFERDVRDRFVEDILEEARRHS